MSDKQPGEPYSEEERKKAVRELTTEFPYLSWGELFHADGDTTENLAVFLKMNLTRAEAELAALRVAFHRLYIGDAEEAQVIVVRADKAEAEISVLRASVPQWVSVKELLPDNDCRIEIADMTQPFPEFTLEHICVNHADLSRWNRVKPHFTHWRLVSLPTPPVPEAQKESGE